MFGDLPPSSKVTSLSVCAAAPRSPAGLRRAGEGDLVDAGVLDERRAGAGAEPGQDVEDAAGQAELLDQRGERERRDGRVLGRLEHDRVAAGERGPSLPGQHHQRRVPGDDRADDADRLAARVGERTGRRRASCAEHALADAREELPVADDQPQLGLRLAQRLAVVARLDQRELVEVLGDELRDRPQHPRPVQRRGCAPSRPRRPPARRRRRRRRPPRPLRRRSATASRAPARTESKTRRSAASRHAPPTNSRSDPSPPRGSRSSSAGPVTPWFYRGSCPPWCAMKPSVRSQASSEASWNSSYLRSKNEWGAPS